MARPLRLEYTGDLYHVGARGNHQENIFKDEDDRLAFISFFQYVCQRCNWVCYAYCLMRNHYHLLIETPNANLPKGVHRFNGIYTQTFNRNNNRIGCLYQGRYKTILVEKDNHLLELSRCIANQRPDPVERVLLLLAVLFFNGYFGYCVWHTRAFSHIAR